jgi:branched-chain amino acid transport system permease protein
VIGGRRSSIGPIIGAIVYIIASDHLPGGDIQGAYFGAMLVLVLLVLPDGITSLPRIVGRAVRRHGSPASPAPRPATGAAVAKRDHAPENTKELSGA